MTKRVKFQLYDEVGRAITDTGGKVMAVARTRATLTYTAQTANYTAGATLTGVTSGATAKILSDVDAGATGTLTIYGIEGMFINGETITDSVTGSAVAGTYTASQVRSCVKDRMFNKQGALITNPMSMTNGAVEFFVGDQTQSLDLYTQSPTGHFLLKNDFRPEEGAGYSVDTTIRHTLMQIPFHAVDYTAAAEVSTGFSEPSNALALPNPAIRVLTLQAAKTILAGGLSSESNGVAAGYINGISLAAVGVVKATNVNGANTMGSYFKVQDSANAGDIAPEARVTQPNTLTLTTSAATTLAEGWLMYPYELAY